MIDGISFVPSPNFSSRKGWRVSGTVIHYTAGGRASGAVSWLCNPVARASAHFVISRSGRIVQLVDLAYQAWHAGVAEMLVEGEMESYPSRFTIGIELANCGNLQRIEDRFFYELGRTLKRYRGPPPVEGTLVYDNGLEIGGWWEPYPNVQIDALQELLRKIAKAGYQQAAENLIGHEEVGMPLGRKRDPGIAFPWERFHRKADRRTWVASA